MMQVRGRHLVLAWTAVFLAVAGVIVSRDRRGFELQKRVRVLNNHVRALISDRDRLAATIARLSTQEVLQPKVEAMGLRIASDSEMVALPVITPR
jgi:cell division protein FtsL